MKIKNAAIWKARTALAKLANTDLPIPAVLAVAPLLDACDQVLADMREAEKNEDEELFKMLAERHTEVPEADLPCLPEIRMNYIEFSAIREIMNVRG